MREGGREVWREELVDGWGMERGGMMWEGCMGLIDGRRGVWIQGGIDGLMGGVGWYDMVWGWEAGYGGVERTGMEAVFLG